MNKRMINFWFTFYFWYFKFLGLLGLKKRKKILLANNWEWENFYQTTERIHRFGKDNPCEVYVVLAEKE